VIPGDTTRAAAFTRFAGWSPDGEQALVFTATSDFKTRFIHAIAKDGSLTEVDELSDTAWVAGPCFGCTGWSRDGSRVWYVSEADGYAHLYSARPDGSQRRQLTSGDWEVLSVELSDDGREFLLHT